MSSVSNARGALQLQVLATATRIKLRELNAHEQRLRVHYEALLLTATDAEAVAEAELSMDRKDDDADAEHETEHDAIATAAAAAHARLATLYAGTKDLQIVQTKLHPRVADVGALVQFATRDPWTTRQSIAQRERQLRREIRQRRSLWRHNKLLGALLHESLQQEAAPVVGAAAVADTTASSPVAVDHEVTDATDAGVAKMTKEETRAQLERYFFAPAPNVDEATVRTFLETNVFQKRASFSTEQWATVDATLSDVRETMRDFSERFCGRDGSSSSSSGSGSGSAERVTPEEVAQAVALLLRNGAAFTDDVVAFLADVQASETTQRELAHVLTIELGNLRAFTWDSNDNEGGGSAGVPVQFKRGMNGRWRCHLQEDAVSLLLFQHVGMKWAEKVREQLTRLLRALDTAPRATGTSGQDRWRPAVSLPHGSVEATRRELREVFTLVALDQNVAYDGDDDDRSSNDSDDSDDDDRNKKKKPTDKSEFAKASKEDLLRLLCTEARYQSVFHDDHDQGSTTPSITAVVTDFEFFGPSVPHAAVLACLAFFGVTDAARAVFARYMQVPLCFPTAEETTTPTPRVMQRGLSVGRAMTMFLSETLLFVMDFCVRADTGIHIFRRHDDVVLFDADAERVVAAWTTMQQWARVAGLRFNADKSGAATLQWRPPTDSTSSPAAVPDVPAALPQQPIQWGLLELQSDASVRILDDHVDAYTRELADRLAAATTVFGWINVYNKYMRFFLRGFGSASPVFGPRHVDAMTATLQRVHRTVFATTHGDVLVALRDRIALGGHGSASHGSTGSSGSADEDGTALDLELPAAWAQWPLELGGLGLFNPFLALWALEPALRAYLTTYHTRPQAPWPPGDDDTAVWPWHEPFTTQRDALLARHNAVLEARARDDGRLAPLVQITGTRDLFAHLTHDHVSDETRQYGETPWNYAVDGSDSEPTAHGWRLRTRDEFLRVVAVRAQRELQNEFKACIAQVQALPPPSRRGRGDDSASPARAAAEAQLHDAGLDRSPYWQWLALLVSEPLMDEFGTVAFFSRELLPAQLIATIQTSSVAW